MMSLLRHRDNAPSLSVPECLSGDRDEIMAEGREVYLSSSLSQDAAEEDLKKPRIVMIREELVDLTGSPLTASILGQMLYWSQRTKDFDLYMAEESADPPKCFSALRHGWFYKANREIIEETLLRVTLVTFRRYMSFLRGREWIQTRRNPQNKLDPKIQYRVNLRKLCADLQRKGHTFPGFAAYGLCPPSEQNSSDQNICEQQDDFFKKENA